MYSVTMAIVNDKSGKEEVISIKVKDEDIKQFRNVVMAFGIGEPLIGEDR